MPRENVLDNFMWSKSIKLFCCIGFVVIFMQSSGVNGVRVTLRLMQERAIVKYANPKYITDVQVFTARRRRNDPYMTNITATIPVTWGNNVTSKFSYVLPTGNTIDMVTRLCDAVDKPWMLEFVKMYSNLTACPTPPGTYRYYNVVIPPKNFPLPLPPGLKKGDTGKVNILFYKTGSKDMLLDITGTTLRLMQERAIVRYSNSKYITDVQVFTARRRRSDPYMTNITATIHQPWGNNVTAKISYVLPTGNTIDMSTRVCDAVDKPWILEFVKMYSNLTVCPVQPGTYRYYNVVIPPKNFPLPLPPGLKKGDSGKVNILLYRTGGKESLLDLTGTVRVY